MKLVTANTNLLFLHHCDRDFDQPTVNDGVVVQCRLVEVAVAVMKEQEVGIRCY